MTDEQTLRTWARRPISSILSIVTSIAAGQVMIGLGLLIVARRFEPEVFGSFSAVYVGSLALGGVLDFGSSQLRTRQLAQGIGIHEFQSWLLRRTLVQLPVVALFAGLSIALLRGSLPTACILGLTMQALTMNIAQGQLAAVRVLRSPAYAALFIALGNTLFLASALSSSPEWTLSLVGLSASGTWILTALLGFASVRHQLPRQGHFKMNPWRGSVAFGLYGVALVLQGVDLLIVRVVAGATEAGELGAVSKWITPVLLIVTAATTFLFPAMSAARSNESAIRVLLSARLVLVGGLAAALATVVFAEALVGALLGPRYEDSSSLLQLLALGTIPVILAQPIAALLQARGRESDVARIMGLSVGVMLAGTTMAVRSIGAAAAPLAGIVGSVIATVLLLRRFKILMASSTDGGPDGPGEQHTAGWPLTGAKLE